MSGLHVAHARLFWLSLQHTPTSLGIAASLAYTLVDVAATHAGIAGALLEVARILFAEKDNELHVIISFLCPSPLPQNETLLFSIVGNKEQTALVINGDINFEFSFTFSVHFKQLCPRPILIRFPAHMCT